MSTHRYSWGGIPKSLSTGIDNCQSKVQLRRQLGEPHGLDWVSPCIFYVIPFISYWFSKPRILVNN